MIDLEKLLIECRLPGPAVIWEVGANHPNQVHTANLHLLAGRVELFEPHPYFAEELRKHFATKKNVLVHEVALVDWNGEAQLRDAGCSSYLDGVKSPRTTDGPPPENVIPVQCRHVHLYDRGDIDVLAIDTEGSEWNVIKNLRSEPYLICVEMAWPQGGYVNPHADEIRAWMSKERYQLVDSDGQDEVYAILP